MEVTLRWIKLQACEEEAEAAKGTRGMCERGNILVRGWWGLRNEVGFLCTTWLNSDLLRTLLCI